MTTTIRCPHCGQMYDLTPEQAPQYAGRTITCTSCQQPFTVHIPSGAGASVPPPYPQQTVYAPPQPAGPKQGNGMAVGSLISGILGFVPSLNRARETANRVKCASNMRQIGLALLQYGNVNGGAYPHDLQTLTRAMPGALDANFFVCPSSNDTAATATPYTLGTGNLSYVYVPGMNTSASIDTILMYEPLTNHDNDGTNILFGDGHVEFIVRQDAEPMIAAVEAGQNPPPPPRQSR